MKKYIVAFLLFFFAYTIYDLHDNYYHTTDSLPTNYNAIDFIHSGRVDLNNYRKLLEDGDLIPITVENKQNKSIYSKQPYINTLLSIPYFYAYTKIHNLTSLNPQHVFQQGELFQIVGKKFASLLTAISVGLLFIVMVNYFRDHKFAILGATVYAFATFAYGTSSQANGTHASSALLISLIYLLLLKLNKSKNSLLPFALGICTALAYSIRPVNIIFLATTIPILIIQKQSKKNIFTYISSLIIFLISYNLFTITNQIPFGVAGEISDSLKNINLITAFKVIITIIFSPNLGLLVYYPVLVFGFLGLILFATKKRVDPILIFTSLIIIEIIGLNSIWWAWWSGYSWGPRMLTEASIPLAFFLVYYLKESSQSLKKYLWVMTLLIISIFNNLVGIYCNDLSWHSKYLLPGHTFQASWNISDPIFPYYLSRRYISVKDISYTNNEVITTNRAFVLVLRPPSFVKTIDLSYNTNK